MRSYSNWYFDYELVYKLLDTEELINYYKKGDFKWYEVMSNLDYDNIHTKNLLHEIDFLQRNIENFVTAVPIENLHAIRILSSHIHKLNRLKEYNLENNDEKMLFSDGLWDILVFNNEFEDENNLLNTIKSI